MPATSSPITSGRLRVHVSGQGEGADELRAQLAYRHDVTLVEDSTHLNGSVDAVLHVADDPERLPDELASIRTMTAAPVIVGAAGNVERLLASAMAHGADDVLLLPQTPESIAFAIRKATRSSAAAAHRTARVITVFSPKGGTGKTVTSTNLARSFAARGLTTLLIDLDVQFGDAGIMLGVTPTATVHDLVSSPGRLDAEKLAGFTTPVGDDHLALLAAPARPEEGEQVSEQVVNSILETAKGVYDVIVVDTAPSFDAPMLAAIEHTDELLVICGPEVPAVKNVRLALETLELLAFSNAKVSVVFNRSGAKGALSRGEIEHALERPLKFVLPDDEAVAGCVNRGRTVVDAEPRSRYGRAITELAAALVPAEVAADARRFSPFGNRS